MRTKPASALKAAAKKSTAKPKAATAKNTVRSSGKKVDYYPNRMTVAVSALAGTMLVLLALIAVLGTR